MIILGCEQLFTCFSSEVLPHRAQIKEMLFDICGRFEIEFILSLKEAIGMTELFLSGAFSKHLFDLPSLYHGIEYHSQTKFFVSLDC